MPSPKARLALGGLDLAANLAAGVLLRVHVHVGAVALDRVAHVLLERGRAGLPGLAGGRAEDDEDVAGLAGLAHMDVGADGAPAQALERELPRQLVADELAGEGTGRSRWRALRSRHFLLGAQLRRERVRAVLAYGSEADPDDEHRAECRNGERENELLHVNPSY